MADQTTPPPALTAAGRYGQLEVHRAPVLQRAQEAAKLTIPSLVPPTGTSDASQLPQPWQSLGARGVNNLAAKLLLALFPPGSSFFRLAVDEFVMVKLKEKASASGAEDPEEDIEDALATVERAINKRLEQRIVRPVLNEVFKHLQVAGNVLLHIMPDGSLQMFPISKYVVARDGEGTPLEIVLLEELTFASLPPHARAIVEAKGQEPKTPEGSIDPKSPIKLYTWIALSPRGVYTVHQEVCDTLIPGTSGSYPKTKPAWLPLRWNYVSGSDYGRGQVEEYIGDLYAYEAISQALQEWAGNAAKVLWLVPPGAVTQKKKIANAPNGAVIDGDEKEIGKLALDKFADFQVVRAQSEEIKHRLEQAFLLTSSIQRDAERVTAEEIRLMAGELEKALGGTYAILSQELQYPLVLREMAILQRERKMPTLPESVQPQIVTGLDGLGRSSDLLKLDQLFEGVAETFQVPAIQEYVSVGEYLRRRGTALGIDTKGLVRSEDDVQAQRQQQMTAAMTQKLGPAAIKAMSDQATAAQSAQTPPTTAASADQPPTQQ